ncbi:hypothetical protein AB0F88_37505 [Streptosporangium sp. NPDC023963]|uniref:hypothetical protein n=1 Tax=Streptosporangium sp. NPDC023963 TaxID=3155608 RepID=UPI0034194AF1
MLAELSVVEQRYRVVPAVLAGGSVTEVAPGVPARGHEGSDEGAWVAGRSTITVQRRTSSCGVIVVARQSVSLGRLRAGQVVTVHVSDSALTIDLDEGPRTVHRTTDLPASGEDRTGFWRQERDLDDDSVTAGTCPG